MSVEYCHDCDKHIDTDHDVEHFEEHEPKIYPPFGYMWGDSEGVLVSDEEAILKVCTNLSDDPNYLEDISNTTHTERLNFLVHNGFRIETEKDNL